jgi:hypothetical protein
MAKTSPRSVSFATVWDAGTLRMQMERRGKDDLARSQNVMRPALRSVDMSLRAGTNAYVKATDEEGAMIYSITSRER